MLHTADRLLSGDPRERRWLWPSVGLAVCAATTIGVAVAISRIEPSNGTGGVWLTLACLPLLGAGVLVAALRPRSALGWMLLLAATASVLSQLQAAVIAGPTIESAWVVWAGDVLWWLVVPLVPAMLLLLPDGRLRSQRWRPVFAAAMLLWAILGVAIAFAPGPLGGLSQVPVAIDNPIGIDAARSVFHLAGRAAQVGLVLVLAVAVLGLIASWRNAHSSMRRRLLWLTCPVVLGFLAVGIGLASGVDEGVAAQIGLFMLLVALPIAICASVLSEDLALIDQLASRALVYGLLVALLTVTYVLVALAVGSLIPGSGRDLGVIVATAVVAVSFAPVRDRLCRAADRRLFGAATDHAAAVAQFSRAIAPASDKPALVGLVDALADTLAASYVELTTVDGVVTGRGTAAGPLLRRPLIWGDVPVGALVIGLPHRSNASSSGSAELVDTLCPFLAAAVFAATLLGEVQSSRAGLVEAIEDERRRIRSDLHDGLGPALAGIGLGLESIENIAARDAPELGARLNRLSDDVASVYNDLRLLARGLRPTPLDELGLVGALRSHAERLTGADTSHVRIVVEDDRPGADSLPAAVELAAYHVAMEAMTNVVRHARARRCDVLVHRDDGLQVDIRDDGCGIGARPAGVGLRSMRDRCEQLGGRLDLADADGTGTLVSAWLPIR